MGLFDIFRRTKKQPGLFEGGEPQVERKEWAFPGGSAVSLTVVSNDKQIIDASTNPELHDQVLSALRAVGIDTGSGFQGLTALPGGGEGVPQPSGDLVDDLARLAELRSSGALTEEEFQAAKAKLLGSAPPPSEPPPAA